MREILFRGQTRRKGEKVRLDGSPVDSNWVYGGIFPNNDGGDFAIIYQQEPEIHKFPVYADTIGQYTGLTDMNGTEIFEGDILCYEGGSDYAVVKYRGDRAAFFVENEDREEYLGEAWDTDVIVVGNIHDNPELIGEVNPNENH